MKILSLIIVISFISVNLFGQSEESAFYSFFPEEYAKTNFSQIDSLDCWFYVLTNKNLSYIDSVMPIGQLTFQRTHAISDSISERLYKSGWLPNYTFLIFDIKDSVYCFERSKLIRIISSCVSPDVGGDIIIFGNFIFINNSVCLHCKRYDNGVDYCRPIINKMFLSIDKTKTTSLEEIVRQFPIKGKL